MYYLFIDLLVCLHCKSVCLHWKIRRFTAFLDSKIHTRLAIVTANELGLAFPPRNLPKKFRPDPSTFYLVIVVTDRQTDRQTYAGDSIIPRESFRGDNNHQSVSRCPQARWNKTFQLATKSRGRQQLQLCPQPAPCSSIAQHGCHAAMRPVTKLLMMRVADFAFESIQWQCRYTTVSECGT